MPRLGGLACHDARKIKLADLHFRINERFLYEYDFVDLWQHQVRIEKWLEMREQPVLSGVNPMVAAVAEPTSPSLPDRRPPTLDALPRGR